MIAALGQGLLFYTVNNAADDLTCRFNPKEATEALTGLGMALTAHPGDGSTVTVPGNVLAWTKDALIAFRDNLAQQGVSLTKLPGAAIGGISPGQRADDAALQCSKQSSASQTISVVTRSNNRVGGSWQLR